MTKTSIENPPTLQLKMLPKYVEYAFLEKDSKLSVMIASKLEVGQKEKLLEVLKEHKRALGKFLT